jgi:hypothetical protein
VAPSATLIAVAHRAPQIAPNLLPWNRQRLQPGTEPPRGAGHCLLTPEAAIYPSEDAVSIDAAMVLRDQFAQDSPAVRAFFDALVELRTGGGRKHDVFVKKSAWSHRHMVADWLNRELGIVAGEL